MYLGIGKTTVSRWNAVWSEHPELWQWSTQLDADAYARLQDCGTYVVEVTAEGYRPFFGTVKSTDLFERLTQ